MEKNSKVVLIPWDPEDPRHFERMYDHKVACGWREDEIPAWKQKVLKRTKFFWWIALADEVPGREKMLEEHTQGFPKGREPLVDSCACMFGSPREPTGKEFIPVGEIALEYPTEEEKTTLNLLADTLWVKNLYISWSIQAGGLGRASMQAVEQIARSAPLNAKYAVLDTANKDFQSSELVLSIQFDRKGRKRPDFLLTNEEWYGRQGYEVQEGKGGIYPWKAAGSEEVIEMPTVIMLKSLI